MGDVLAVSIWRWRGWTRETVYNRILSRVIRSPIFHQLSYSFFSRRFLRNERTQHLLLLTAQNVQRCFAFFLFILLLYIAKIIPKEFNPIINIQTIKYNKSTFILQTYWRIKKLFHCLSLRRKNNFRYNLSSHAWKTVSKRVKIFFPVSKTLINSLYHFFVGI